MPKAVDEPLATVVMPCLNGAPYLAGMLGSLAADPLHDRVEVIVSDNGSSDASVAIAESFSTRLPGLRVLDASRRKGRTAAGNAGAEQARSRYLLFLDVDDEIEPGYIGAMIDGLGKADLVGGVLDITRLNAPWVAATRPLGSQATGLSDYLGFLPIIGGCVLGVRRQVFQALGGLHEVPFAEDVDFSWRAQLAGHSVAAVPGARLHYRYRDTLRAIYRQSVNYGRAQPLLYTMYAAHGLARRPPREVGRDWIGMAKALARVRTKAELGGWLSLFGVLWGRVLGSIRQRQIFL
jgi:GT2 family glycosyltransferase